VPAQPAAREADAGAPPSDHGAGVVDILVVDDRPQDQTAIAAVLDDPRYRLTMAASGTDALRALLRTDFAVVVLDVRMPGMDGFEVATMVRERERSAHTPILFITGEAADVGAIYRGYAVGAVDYLLKPVDPDILRAKVAVFVALFDKDQRIRAQTAALLHAERAQRELAMRDEFLSIASHELRTPLSALLVQLGSVERTLDLAVAVAPGVDRVTRARDKVASALRHTNRLAGLVDSLLDVSRLAQQRLELQPEPCDLAEIVRDVADRFGDEARRLGCDLVIDVRPAPGRWDHARVEQIVINLVSNAIKYGAGAPVELTGGPLAAGGATLTVRDHGIGIDDADRARIFERFERAAPSRNYGGLGLGLYIARELVAAHKGTISVVSEPGAGAAFTITLPAAAGGDSEEMGV
jgi:signal transduction histidine kinase